MQKPREIVFSTSAEKTVLSTYHTLQSARIAPRPRPMCPDGFAVSTSIAFCRNVLGRRDTFENRQQIDKHSYIYLVYLKIPLADVVNLKILGVSQVEKGEHRRPCVYEPCQVRWCCTAAAAVVPLLYCARSF